MTLATHKLINFLLFQLGWFACILSGAAQIPWLGCSAVLLILAWHLWHANRPGRELTLLVLAMLIGSLWDSLLVTMALLHYPDGILLPNTAPYWIVALWALFASTLNLSLHWLRQHVLLSVLLGAIAGPLAYLGGARLGAVSFVQPGPAIFALALGWAVLTPLLVKLASRFDGYAYAVDRGRV